MLVTSLRNHQTLFFYGSTQILSFKFQQNSDNLRMTQPYHLVIPMRDHGYHQQQHLRIATILQKPCSFDQCQALNFANTHLQVIISSLVHLHKLIQTQEKPFLEMTLSFFMINFNFVKKLEILVTELQIFQQKIQFHYLLFQLGYFYEIFQMQDPTLQTWTSTTPRSFLSF